MRFHMNRRVSVACYFYYNCMSLSDGMQQWCEMDRVKIRQWALDQWTGWDRPKGTRDNVIGEVDIVVIA